MKLYLTQHGEAHSKEQDPNRPLNQKGVTDIEHVAKFLKRADIQVNRIIHSGKLRARQTAGYFAEQIAVDIELETRNTINPKDSPESLARQCNSWEEDTLIVGHLPFLSRLVSYLIAGDEELSMVSFQPGSVICLERSEDEKWVINWMIRPGLFS